MSEVNKTRYVKIGEWSFDIGDISEVAYAENLRDAIATPPYEATRIFLSHTSVLTHRSQVNNIFWKNCAYEQNNFDLLRRRVIDGKFSNPYGCDAITRKAGLFVQAQARHRYPSPVAL